MKIDEFNAAENMRKLFKHPSSIKFTKIKTVFAKELDMNVFHFSIENCEVTFVASETHILLGYFNNYSDISFQTLKEQLLKLNEILPLNLKAKFLYVQPNLAPEERTLEECI